MAGAKMRGRRMIDDEAGNDNVDEDAEEENEEDGT
jgi:hypothetical protein